MKGIYKIRYLLVCLKINNDMIYYVCNDVDDLPVFKYNDKVCY